MIFARRKFESVALLCALAFAFPIAGFTAESTRNVSNKKQLFIDDRFIAHSTNVKLVANPPELAGPALEPGKPNSWDDGKITWGQVVEDEGIFKMWAGGFSAEAMKGDWKELEVNMRLGYATSKDGIKWTKPKLGLFEWKGSKQNNIVNPDLGYVMIDPKGKPDERYKMLCTGANGIGAKNIYDALKPESGGLYFYTSPDGIHWKWNPQMIFPFHPDTLNQIDYDEKVGRYVAYIRAWPNGFLFKKTYGRAVGRVELDDPMSPWPYKTNIPPVKPWGPKMIATPGKEIPTAFTFPDYNKEGVWTDVYNACVSVYPWAEDAYFAFPSLNKYLPDSPSANDSTLNIGMVVSRDGIKWQWPTTAPYIPYGKPGSGRSGQLYALVGMLRVGDKIYQYHTGSDLRHNVDWAKDFTLDQLRNVGRIYRTVQRLDGFVSADFSDEGGELTTPLLKFLGDTLRLNINAAKGSGHVEVLDENDLPIPGFEASACKTIKTDSVNRLVEWKKGKLSDLKGREIRLRFRMQTAKLYAFQFTDR